MNPVPAACEWLHAWWLGLPAWVHTSDIEPLLVLVIVCSLVCFFWDWIADLLAPTDKRTARVDAEIRRDAAIVEDRLRREAAREYRQRTWPAPLEPPSDAISKAEKRARSGS
jgi:hypothetical protein